MTKREEALKALQCLYLEVDEKIADDVKQKVMAALDEGGYSAAQMKEYGNKVIHSINDHNSEETYKLPPLPPSPDLQQKYDMFKKSYHEALEINNDFQKRYDKLKEVFESMLPTYRDMFISGGFTEKGADSLINELKQRAGL